MPYVPEDPNQPQQSQPQNPAALNAPVTTSSAPGSGPGATGKTGQVANQTPAQPFTNLQDYLTANAPQINQQADTIAGQLTGQYGQAKSGVDAAAQNFGAQVQSGYAPADAGLVNQAASNPATFVQNPDNVSAFQKQFNDAYTGPTNFEGTDAYGTAQANVQKAVENANLVNSMPGLQTYLQNTETNPTQGENTLDTALLAAQPAAIQKVTTAARPFASLPDYLSGTVTAQDHAVQDAVKAAQTNAQAVQGQFMGPNGVVPNFQTSLDANVANAKTDLANRVAADKQFLTNGYKTGAMGTGFGPSYPPEVLQDLGLTPQQADQILNLQYQDANPKQPPSGTFHPIAPYAADLTQYLTSNPGAFTRENVASPNDFATQAALQLLTGAPVNYLNGTSPSTTPNALSFDQVAALRDVLMHNTPLTPTVTTPPPAGGVGAS